MDSKAYNAFLDFHVYISSNRDFTLPPDFWRLRIGKDAKDGPDYTTSRIFGHVHVEDSEESILREKLSFY